MAVAAATESSQAAPLVAAGLAVASLPLHAWMLLAHAHGVVPTSLMAAMTLWCLGCAVGVVRAPAGPGRAAPCSRTRSLRHLWAMGAVMALLHVGLLTDWLGLGGGHAGHAMHGAATGTGAGAGVSEGTSLMLAVVVLEVAICFACAVALRRRGRCSPAA